MMVVIQYCSWCMAVGAAKQVCVSADEVRCATVLPSPYQKKSYLPF